MVLDWHSTETIRLCRGKRREAGSPESMVAGKENTDGLRGILRHDGIVSQPQDVQKGKSAETQRSRQSTCEIV